jgi:hypothetical protein
MRNRKQSLVAARLFADDLRRIDTANDFTIMQRAPEVVVARISTKKKYPAIVDIMALVAKQIAVSNTFEDVHLHFDGDSLSLYFTETY